MKAQPSRSARVLAAVQAGGPVTLEALAAEVGATERQVYTCLWWIAKRGALPANGRAAMAPKVPQRGNREEGHVCEGARPSRPRRLHVVTDEDGPRFESCTTDGGLRRDTCERYEACLDAAARAAMAHARCTLWVRLVHAARPRARALPPGREPAGGRADLVISRRARCRRHRRARAARRARHLRALLSLMLLGRRVVLARPGFWLRSDWFLEVS